MQPMRTTRRNLGNVAAGQLLDDIRAGRYVPGDRLPTEKGLAQAFGIGRNAVREALQALVAIGVVDVRPGRGSVVLGIPSEDVIGVETVSALLEDQAVSDLHEFRQVMEVEIAGRAAERASGEDVARIRAALVAYRLALEEGLPVYEADIRLHRAITAATHNSVYDRVLDALTDLLASARRQSSTIRGSREKALPEHTEIVEAIERGDAAGAREAMRHHLETASVALSEARRVAQRWPTSAPHETSGDRP
jgi:GntR family transcriptional repressor for pyruvate dehydrogenase complex